MNHAFKRSSVFVKNRKATLLSGFIFVLFVSVIMFGASVKGLLAENSNVQQNVSQDNAKNQELINQKLQQIKNLQAEINKYQSNLDQKRKEGRTLKNEIAIYDGNIVKNQLEIEETKANIERAEMEMQQSKQKIEEDGRIVEESRQSLKISLQELYSYQQDSILEILMANTNISDYFNKINSSKSVQNSIFENVARLKQEKIDLSAKNEKLQGDQEEYQNLINMKSEQNSSLEDLKSQKNDILRITNGEEGEFQALVSENQSILPSLRAQLRDLQSLGTSIKFDDAISAAKYVGNVTGVRPALLLGILRVESGLGTNVGGGTYKTDMNPNQQAAFEQITAGLGYDPNAMPVSKRAKSYSSWGGAMGPAQMMPTTWLIYENEVSQIVKRNPPDPWNITDALAAVAVKLSKVDGVLSGDYEAEYKAAGIYLAGNNWEKYTFYPDKVMYYADLYEKELGE